MERKKYEVKYNEKEYPTNISAVDSAEEESICNSKYDVQFENALSFLLNPNEEQRDSFRSFDSNNAANIQHFVFMGDDHDNKRTKARQYKKLNLSYKDIVKDISEITISSDSEAELNIDTKKLKKNKRRSPSKVKEEKSRTKAAAKEVKENKNQKDKGKSTKNTRKESQSLEEGSLNNAESIRDGRSITNSRRGSNELEASPVPENKMTKRENKERKSQKDKGKSTKNTRKESQSLEEGSLNNAESIIDGTSITNSRRGSNEFEPRVVAENKITEKKRKKENEVVKRERTMRRRRRGKREKAEGKEADLGREVQEEISIAGSPKGNSENSQKSASLSDDFQKESHPQDYLGHKGTVMSIHKKLDQSAPAVEPIKTIVGITHHQVLHLPLSDVKIKTLIASSAASKISKHVLKSIISHSHTIFSQYQERRLFCILCIEVALQESRGFKKVIKTHQEALPLLEKFSEFSLESTRGSPTPSNKAAHKNPFDYNILSYIGYVLLWARSRQAEEGDSTFFERYNIPVNQKDISKHLGGYYLWDALCKTSTINSKRWKHIIKFRKIFAYEEDQFLLILRFMNIGEEVP